MATVESEFGQYLETVTSGGKKKKPAALSVDEALLAVTRKHGWARWNGYLPLIAQAAEFERVDPVVLLLFAAFGDPAAGKATPKYMRQLAAALMRAFRQAGTVQGAWEALGGKGQIEAQIPKRYGVPDFGQPKKPAEKPLTPEQEAAAAVYGEQLREGMRDPWVVIEKGKLKFVSGPDPPRDVVDRFSLGVRRSEFMRSWSYYNDIYQAFTGRKARAGEVARILEKGWTDYTLKLKLSKTPQFQKSAMWRANAPAFLGVARDLLGDHWNEVPQEERKELLRRAIVEGWDGASFAERLRSRPEYLKGPEFSGMRAGLQNVYEAIFGSADANAGVLIREAALARWDPDQFASYLRHQPGYTSSPEYLTKALGVLDALGMITGTLPALRPGTPAPNTAAGQVPGAPNSPRIPGTPGPPQAATAGLVPATT